MQSLSRFVTFAAAGALVVGGSLLAQTDWASPPGRNFPVTGGSLWNQRYSTLSKIDRTNLARLGGAWMIHLEGGKPAGNMQGTPVVLDGLMFIGSGSGNIFAINAATGAVAWKYDSTFGAQTNRGVVAAEGKVFSGQAGGRLVAVDQETGRLLWETKLAERGGTPGGVLYSQGRVFDGMERPEPAI